MKLTADQYRPLGPSGLRVPPIAFATSALCDPRHVLPDQTRINVVGAWFKHVEPPVLVDVGGDDAARQDALFLLQRALAKFEIDPEEVSIAIRLSAAAGGEEAFNANDVLQTWEEACQLLSVYAPRIAVLDGLDEDVSAVVDKLRAYDGVSAVGIASSDSSQIKRLAAEARVDFVELTGGYTLLSHPPEVVACLRELAGRQVSVIHSDPFQGGFLNGEDGAHGGVVGAMIGDNEKILKWRRSFTALCHGHGVAPGHACVQFALAAPGTMGVVLGAKHPDRVGEQVEWVGRKAPAALWYSMREEGLIETDTLCPQ